MVKKLPKTYEVEVVVDSRGSGSKKEYFVKWVGYSSKENTWEPAAHLHKQVRLVPGSALGLLAVPTC